MILFRHTRWKKHKTAWVWLHVKGAYCQLISRWAKRDVYGRSHKVLCRVRWDNKKPYVWVRRPGWEKANRYLAPDGKVPGRSVTWSCAYPERPLWYPDSRIFTQEELNPGGVAVGLNFHMGLGPAVQGVHQIGVLQLGAGGPPQPVHGIVRQAVVDIAEAGIFDDFYEDDDPDHGE